MGILKAVWKIIYLISAVAVGVGCLHAFVFFIFNLGDGFLSNDNKPAAFGVAALAIVGTTVFLLLGRLIYNSNIHIGPTLGIIIVAAILTMPAIEVGYNVIGIYQTFRAKPYVERYFKELKPAFVEKITPLEFDDKESKSDTLRVWRDNVHSIWIKLRKKDGTLSSEDLKNVIGALPPAKYDVRVFIYYESFKEYPSEYTIDFARRNNPVGPPYCESNDYENDPCNFIKEFLEK
ncbi:hypothetical protein [Paenibacillus harenae]|uniref:hypothetical protein n=1 Tax=Paenibacillus harenae TaxID=306543 RepID=UPI00278DE3A3|nr:hypothetical protein [Paenibacillus harenae]MDQ0060194.1 hypothetical protein [Paenibacillus harenae]